MTSLIEKILLLTADEFMKRAGAGLPDPQLQPMRSELARDALVEKREIAIAGKSVNSCNKPR
ncbi:hypothetical protein OPU71_10270 [Niveibacterium sp. 24ML]|uniref:hypothetical protein n=1 Tax=Niveibacterium sp. 24ML TaxID=2985512 RepID=UPI00226D7C87|nr:hypothetical protein [Niveibacterium sp. 24ML]MCX9156506.1 hypothetical protein [Niveibacterium sp. 24ML]